MKRRNYFNIFGAVFSLTFYAMIGINIYQTKILNTPITTKSNTLSIKSSQISQPPNSLSTNPSNRIVEPPNQLEQKKNTSPQFNKNTPNNKNINSRSLPQILIYHSHNRESWIPELSNIQTANEAFDPKTNVTLLGDYLLEKMESNDIPAFHSKKDYPTVIETFNYANSYAYSKSTIQKELRMHGNIQYLIDIHRDSQGRENTTVQYKNKNYAQVYFVVGTNNPKWEMNMKFAERLHHSLNDRVPGLSKGIYKKDSRIGNGDYNQGLSPNSALIEIGGVENNLDESYRTVSILAKVIQDIWLQDNLN